jgi:putative transposase
MPVSKKKRTTSIPEPSTSDPSSPVLPDQQVFHQYLRTLAQRAVRVVIETVMREELDQFIGAAWGECSRQQQRLPQWALHARSGHLHWSAPGYQRAKTIVKVSSTPKPSNATVAMNRTLPKGSRRCSSAVRAPTKWAKWPKRCWESLEVASTISRLNQTLTQPFDTWRERPLQTHWRILYLDGVHFSIRHGDKADSTIILTALGVDLSGNKEVVARPCLCRGKQSWMGLEARKTCAGEAQPRSI